MLDSGFVDFAPREKPRVRVNLAARIEEIVRRDQLTEVEIGLIERADGADIFPVSLEDVAVDMMLFNATGDNVFSEVVEFVIEDFFQDIPIEEVDAHGSLEGFFLFGQIVFFQHGGRHAQFLEDLSVARFFLKSIDGARGIGLHDTKAFGFLTVDGEGGDGEVGTGFQVFFDDASEIEVVELVAAEDEEVFVFATKEIAQVLSNCIGSSLIPLGAGGCLLGGEDFDKIISEPVEFVGAIDVAMEGGAIVLGKEVNFGEA